MVYDAALWPLHRTPLTLSSRKKRFPEATARAAPR
jgi:hypothetical protein